MLAFEGSLPPCKRKFSCRKKHIGFEAFHNEQLRQTQIGTFGAAANILYPPNTALRYPNGKMKAAKDWQDFDIRLADTLQDWGLWTFITSLVSEFEPPRKTLQHETPAETFAQGVATIR